MGHKTHPVGFRLGVIKDWHARWFARGAQEYRILLHEDLRIRRAIFGKFPDAGISRVEIERGSQDLVINIHTARPGIVIGRGGARVEDLRQSLERLTEKRIRLNVLEVRQPELDAYLVARNIGDQLERRIAFRRAMRQALARAMQAGAQGVKIICSGRLAGAEIARTEKAMDGRVPLHTLRADIDFAIAEAKTQMGVIGVKVWVCKGEILPQPEETEEEVRPIEVRVMAGEGEAEAPQQEQQAAPEAAAAQATAPVQETPDQPAQQEQAGEDQEESRAATEEG